MASLNTAPTVIPPDTLLTTREVSDLLRLGPDAIKRLTPTALPYFRVNPRGDRRYRALDVTAYLEARRVETA